MSRAVVRAPTDEPHFRAWTDPSISAARITLSKRAPAYSRDAAVLAVVGAIGWAAGLFIAFGATTMTFVDPGPIGVLAPVLLAGSIGAAAVLARRDALWAHQQRLPQVHPIIGCIAPAVYLGLRTARSTDAATGRPFWTLLGLSAVGTVFVVLAYVGLYGMWVHGY